ncbi:hypothetical protein HID58_061076 [Brassica napus]|uniref:Aminotransferase-like plant mobile domain-containing protein n=2 Tax=Brassica napus TaxID=3708 RepID=A0ABQ7ZYP2_BRANA|nr:hypothetical protein HID58_061076 [Brassica napus]
MRKMEALHEPTWRKAGIFEAIKALTFKIREDPSLIQALAENWCPETKSLVIPWGEATVTLEDVMVLLRFSVLGFPVFASLESSEMRRAVKRLEKARTKILGNRNNGYRVSQLQWTLRFKDIDDDDSLEHEALEEQKKVNVEVSYQVRQCMKQLAEDKVKRWEALQEISTNKHLLIKIRGIKTNTQQVVLQPVEDSTPSVPPCSNGAGGSWLSSGENQNLRRWSKQGDRNPQSLGGSVSCKDDLISVGPDGKGVKIKVLRSKPQFSVSFCFFLSRCSLLHRDERNVEDEGGFSSLPSPVSSPLGQAPSVSSSPPQLAVVCHTKRTLNPISLLSKSTFQYKKIEPRNGAEQAGVKYSDFSELCENGDAVNKVQQSLTKATKVEKIEIPAKIKVGTSTAALKIKREKIKAKFKDELHKLIIPIHATVTRVSAVVTFNIWTFKGHCRSSDTTKGQASFTISVKKSTTT